MLKVLIIVAIIVSILCLWLPNIKVFFARRVKKEASKKNGANRYHFGSEQGSTSYNLNRVLIDYTKKTAEDFEVIDDPNITPPEFNEITSEPEQPAPQSSEGGQSEEEKGETDARDSEGKKVMPKGLEFLKKFQEFNNNN